MQWHIEQAVAAGASEGEVLEAVEVGIEMGAVPPPCRPGSPWKSWNRCFQADWRGTLPHVIGNGLAIS